MWDVFLHSYWKGAIRKAWRRILKWFFTTHNRHTDLFKAYWVTLKKKRSRSTWRLFPIAYLSMLTLACWLPNAAIISLMLLCNSKSSKIMWTCSSEQSNHSRRNKMSDFPHTAKSKLLSVLFPGVCFKNDALMHHCSDSQTISCCRASRTSVACTWFWCFLAAGFH